MPMKLSIYFCQQIVVSCHSVLRTSELGLVSWQRLLTITITWPPGMADWINAGPGALNVITTNSGCRLILLNHWKWRALQPRADRMPINGWRATQCLTARMEWTSTHIKKVKGQRLGLIFDIMALLFFRFFHQRFCIGCIYFFMAH